MHQMTLTYQNRLMYSRAVVATAPEEAPLHFLQLVADPLRWQLLGELARSDRRVGEVAQRLGKAQNLVSYHLGELRSGGLVSARQSSADGRDTYYRLHLARLGELFVTAGAALHPALQLGPSPVQAPRCARGAGASSGSCSSAQATRRAHRSLRRCWWLVQAAPSRPRAPAATRSRCTPMRCASCSERGSTSRGRPASTSTASRAPASTG